VDHVGIGVDEELQIRSLPDKLDAPISQMEMLLKTDKIFEGARIEVDSHPAELQDAADLGQSVRTGDVKEEVSRVRFNPGVEHHLPIPHRHRPCRIF